MVTITLESEDGAEIVASANLKVDNYGVCPQFEFDAEYTQRSTLDVEATVVMAARVGGIERKRYTLVWEGASEGQMWVVKKLFEDGGQTAAMNFIPPDETEIVEVRFIGDLEVTRTSATAWSMRFTVEEVL